jgi:hypothetical protein
MVTVIITHEVKDFSEWKKGFDSDETRRAAAGIMITGVYSAADNANNVTVTSEFPNMDVVNGFMNDPNMHEIMEKVGVISQPEVKILNRV